MRKPGAFAVSDVELASRVSFFLWSSIPDDELLAAAEAGSLREPGVLRAQVQRMLADPRSEAMVTNFAAQWLFLRDVAVKDPDIFLFPDHDPSLRVALERETELFVDSVFRSGGSVLELLTAKHTFVNERLAKHYGIPHVQGSYFRRVELGPDSRRSGLLGQGSILTVTSYAARTSPVLRGKYVLDNLLASPPPPPPPDVPSLATEDAADGAPLTLREAMIRHRAYARVRGLPREDGPDRLRARALRRRRPVARRGRRRADRSRRASCPTAASSTAPRACRRS